jgi:ribonucleoside-diphosphate reductase alpha chain
MTRNRLPNRRRAETFDLQSQGLRFTCSISRLADGSLAEVFLTNHKAGSAAGINASDSAVIASIALQYGVPLEVIRRALMRDAKGKASSPRGCARDQIGDAP